MVIMKQGFLLFVSLVCARRWRTATDSMNWFKACISEHGKFGDDL
jgi:hypothetical protein